MNSNVISKLIPNGLFVAFEGADGCGKSELSLRISNVFRDSGYRVLHTAEPTDFETGLKIRRVLKKEEPAPLNPNDFQDMYIRDRRHHIIQRLKPALQRGTLVVTDRYWLSTCAYGMLSGLSADYFRQRHADIIGDHMIVPNITFLLSVSLDTVRQRKAERGTKEEHFEKEALQAKIIDHYVHLAGRQDFGTIKVIDANRTREEVFNDVHRELSAHLISRTSII